MPGFRTFSSYDPLYFQCIVMALMYIVFHSKLCCAEVGNQTDMLALLAFKDRIANDPFQVLSSWNHSLHFCQWKGVTCGRRHQRVTRLDLGSLKISGELSASTANLSFLRYINLSNNSFTGEVPQDMGRLFRLQELYLNNNSSEGHIPKNLSGCSKLQVLRLVNNKLTGFVPSELGGLKKLLYLGISVNYLSGTIPPSLGNLSSVKKLALSHNQIEGFIPESLGQLKSLGFFYLNDNKFSGSVPSSVYNLSNLVEIDLSMNQLDGNLPRNLGHKHGLPNIRIFSIFQNQFNGTIPASLSNASKLYYLDLADNQFVGGVPIDFGNMKMMHWLELGGNNLGNREVDDLSFITSLTNCSHLAFLEMEENNFGGVLPRSLANLSTTLQRLNLEGNKITGNIPQGIENLVGLQMISMSLNQLTGTIPMTIGNLYRLQQAVLAANQLSGWIPSSISNLSQLSWLVMAENNLQGRIPASLGNCSNLLLLQLSDNKLGGNIPIEVLGLPSLSITLNLSGNHLSGPIPSEVGNLIRLVELDISRNKLLGQIPTTLGACIGLLRLFMNDNSFVGSIPNSVGSLRAIEEIDLSHNNLTGELPQSLATLPFLQILSLSFNDFEGKVPLSGVFANTSAISLIGNKKLCGGIPDLRLPKCFANKARKHKISPIPKLVISLICALLGLSVVLFLVLIYTKKKARNEPHPTFSLLDPFVNLAYGDIFKATDGFSSLNLIGTGNFGSVYRGILDPQKQIVAIKLLNLQAKGATRSFMAECEAIKNIRHRNLVKVITTCSSIDYQGNDFKALVYECMQNGSLEIWLHPLSHAGDTNHAKPKTLSFSQRLNVVIDVAAALDYLHNHCEVPIIHRNLHPSNILLDKLLTSPLLALQRWLNSATMKCSRPQQAQAAVKEELDMLPLNMA